MCGTKRDLVDDSVETRAITSRNDDGWVLWLHCTVATGVSIADSDGALFQRIGAPAAHPRGILLNRHFYCRDYTATRGDRALEREMLDLIAEMTDGNGVNP